MRIAQTRFMASMSTVTVTPGSFPKPPGYEPIHHVGGNPPTSFKNPWPSAGTNKQSLIGALRTRFFNSNLKNHVPTPTDRKGLPKILTPDWGSHSTEEATDSSSSTNGSPSPPSLSMKVTWIGHASFLVEMPTVASSPTSSQPQISSSAAATATQRGVRILLDPVFSSNMSPFSFGGPKRISPPPCPMESLPSEIDLVLISHDHYDHLDITTIQFINTRGKGRIRYMCGLGVGKHLVSMGVLKEHVMEMDWWEGANVTVDGVGEIKVICTPSQHFSGRWWNDHGHGLWCSWVIEENNSQAPPSSTATTTTTTMPPQSPSPAPGKKLFFGGDTGYRFKPQGTLASDYEKLPSCPAFSQIGSLHGPFSLALLPIGCYAPRYFMSHIHCAPEDSICIHRDVKARKSIGMHWGTVRGNISEFYEDSVEPPVLWKAECEKAGLKWRENNQEDWEIGLCDIGETLLV